MTLNLRHAFLSVLYALALSWLLIYEIVPRWGYMNYAGEYSTVGIFFALVVSAVLGSSVPRDYNARMMIISSLNYIYFVPAGVYIYFSSNIQLYHLFSFVILCFFVYYFSRIRIIPIRIANIQKDSIITIISIMIGLAIVAQISYGGLRYFNLNIASVYEFRRISAFEIPSIFRYIFSNVANVLVPVGLILAISLKRYFVATLIVAFAIVLFGMTHHKSVLFTPFAVIFLYLCFAKARSAYLIGGAFLAIPLVSIAEVLYIREVFGSSGVAYFTSLVIRRILFTPVMLDSLFVDFFSQNAHLYWSSSKFGSWANESTYVIAAPFIIGTKYFSNPEMSANAGVIGSGFANAGVYGVFLYSIIIGMVISVLNEYGRRAGHAVVAAVSLVTIFLVVTTTDLATALMSHGLILLLIILSLFSGPTPETSRHRLVTS